MPTKKKKKYNARFPPARIKKIMQSDEDVGKVAAAVPVIISKSLELFVETLLKNVNDVIERRGARTLTPSHLKRCVAIEPRFDFLKELVADVPDLLGEFDADRDSAPPVEFHAGRVVPKNNAAAADEAAAAAAVAIDLSTSTARKRGSVGSEKSDDAGRPKRKRLTRKKSTDSTSRRKYMDDDADDDDEVFAASDEDGAEENGKGSRVGGGEGSEEDENSSGGRLSPVSLPDTTSAKSKDKSKLSRRRPSLGRSVSCFTANSSPNGAAASHSTNGGGSRSKKQAEVAGNSKKSEVAGNSKQPEFAGLGTPPTFTLSFPPVQIPAAAAASNSGVTGATKGSGKFSMSSILGTTTSSTPLLKAALTSSPLGSLGSSVVTSTTASATVTSEAASGNLEIDIDEDYDA